MSDVLDQLPLAHGIGGPEDLPIPLGLTIAGGVAALVISFAVLALAWRTPRYRDAPARPAPAWLGALVDSTGFAVVTRGFGLALFGYTAWVAFAGPDLLINPFFGMIYVLLWVGLVPLSLLLGSFWRAISPVRTLHLLLAKATGGSPGRGMYDYPERLGYWPAALGLFAFVWMELVYPYSAELGPLRLWMAAYVAIMLIGSAVFGDAWFERADPFEVFSTLVGHLSVWSRDDDGLVLRSPLANLARVDVQPGLVAVIGVLFGSTAFDSFHSSERWVGYIQASQWVNLSNNAALLGFCLVAGGLFTIAALMTGVGPEVARAELPNRLAHSVVPIVCGYFVAHYLSYFVITGQETLKLMSDPMGTGANLFRTAAWPVNDWLLWHPTLLATIKVLGVVLGHVIAVVAAHDRAIELLPRKHQLTGQLSMLVVMVMFTIGGLWLLFSA